MKKLFLLLAASALTFSSIANTPSENKLTLSPTAEVNEWTKADNWVGKDGKTLYKYEKVLMEIKYSLDGKKWEKSKEEKWQDKDGKWLKISDKKLWRSEDGGNTWAEAPEWKWQGGDGKWYKFDSDWTLWKSN